MKRILLTTFTCLLFAAMAIAQAPEAFQYQAVVRDAGGQILAGQAVGMQISLIQDDGVDTATVYVETHDAITNDFGLVNLQIGYGTPTLGNFSEIDWAIPIYVEIGLDVAGGSSYEMMGVAQLLSVPYALYAANAGSTDDADPDPTNELQNWSTLPGIPADILDGDQVDDADADATNELELPQDAEIGSVAYYDGESWKKVPQGEAGQVLTLGEDGLPFWGNLVNIDNAFTYDGTTYALVNGYFNNLGSVGGGNYDWDVILSSSEVTIVNGLLTGTGEYIYLDLNTSSAEDLVPGTYTWATTRDAFTLVAGSEVAIDYNIATFEGTREPVTGGTVTVAIDGEIYTIEFDLTLQSGKTAKGAYRGELVDY